MMAGDGLQGEGDPHTEVQTLSPGGVYGTGSAQADAVALYPYCSVIMIFCYTLGSNGKSIQESCCGKVIPE